MRHIQATNITAGPYHDVVIVRMDDWEQAIEEYDSLKAERDALRAELAAIKAAGEDATEYVLALENKRLRAEVAECRKRLTELGDF
jgi:seryl-tRNA synthetase